MTITPEKYNNSLFRIKTIINICVQKSSFVCLHNHIRYVNEEDLEELYNYIISLNNDDLCINTIKSIYNQNHKNKFLHLYCIFLVNKYFVSPTDDLLNKCRYIMYIIPLNILCNIYKYLFSLITFEEFKLLMKISTFNIYKFKEFALYSNIDIINFVHNNEPFKHINIINYIVDIANNDKQIKFDVIKWIINNYNIIEHLEYIIDKITNNSNNSYIIIDYLFYLMNIQCDKIYKIFKKIIFNGNLLLFSYMSIKYFSHIKDFNYFEYACLYSNPSAHINNTVIGHAYIKTNLDIEKIDSIFNTVYKNNIYSSIKWFTTFFSTRYSIKPLCINKSYTEPSLSSFYMDKKITFHTEKINEECCICFDNNNYMIKLNCHDTHIICSSCFATSYNIKEICPLCRSDIVISLCTIH